MILPGDVWDHFDQYGKNGWLEFGGGNTGIFSNECKEMCKECQVIHPYAIIGVMSVKVEPQNDNRNYLIIYKEEDRS